MNAKISVFVTCVEVIIYLLLYNSHEHTLRVNCVIINALPNHIDVSPVARNSSPRRRAGSLLVEQELVLNTFPYGKNLLKSISKLIPIF